MLNQIVGKFLTCQNAKCKCKVKEFYIHSTDKRILLFDDDTSHNDQPTLIVEEGMDYQIELINPNLSKLTLVKLDKCLFNDVTFKKCDCLILDSKNFFYLEIKNTKIKVRKNARKEAVKQLESTIIKLQSQLDFEGYNQYAVIGFKTSKPSIIRASGNSLRVKFYEIYKVLLQEGSSIEFN